MRNYIVRFYRKAEKQNEKDTFLGLVETDDLGVNQELTLTGKAFRLAPPKCLMANLVKIQQV